MAEFGPLPNSFHGPGLVMFFRSREETQRRNENSHIEFSALGFLWKRPKVVGLFEGCIASGQRWGRVAVPVCAVPSAVIFLQLHM